MPNVMPISGVAAGSTGSPYLTKLTYTTKATGNYPVTEANFAGIGAYLPGWVLVVALTPATSTVPPLFMSRQPSTPFDCSQ